MPLGSQIVDTKFISVSGSYRLEMHNYGKMGVSYIKLSIMSTVLHMYVFDNIISQQSTYRATRKCILF